MEYTKLVSFLEALGYVMYGSYDVKEPKDWMVITINKNEDDVLEVLTKTCFNGKGISFPEVVEQVIALNEHYTHSKDDNAVVIWGQWK